MDEENFPRGGVRQKSNPKQTIVKDKGLFQQQETPKSQGKKKLRKRKNKKDTGNSVTDLTSDGPQPPSDKKKHKVEGKVASHDGTLVPQTLSKKILYPGMLMLGCVKSIQSYSLTVVLPNGLSGMVPITNISQAYTDSLQKFAQQQETSSVEDIDNVSTLREIFRVGMIVPCKLSEGDKEEDKKLTLSINPRDVNGDIQATSITNGMCIYGNISSHEDHGYIVDIGVQGVQAFLKKQNAEEFIQKCQNGDVLRVGQCVFCKVQLKGDKGAGKPGKNRVINVTIVPEKLDKGQAVQAGDGSEVLFSSLTPGMKVKATVEKIVKDTGLVVNFCQLKGVVHKSHLPEPVTKYKQGQQVFGTILYIHPLVKSITLSLLPHLVQYTGFPENIFQGVKVGDIIEDAVVTGADKSRGVFLQWKEKYNLFTQLYNMSDNKVDNISKAFEIGSTHRCRVLGFFLIEGLVIVTLKKSMIDQKFMSLADVHLGELVECTIKKFTDKGVMVELGNGIIGSITKMHLADITIKQPEQKFKVGEKLRCRVLTVNKKRSNVTLTHKKSLVTSKYPIITALNQVKVGDILEGFITSVKQFGCHVKFYNDVQGLAPAPLLSTERIEYPEKVFYMGQIVRCRVIDVNPDDNKLKLTFVLEGKKQFGKKEADIPEDYEVGKCVKCTVLRKGPNGVDVELENSGKTAYLPKVHLSDSVDLCNALWQNHTAGDIIERAVYWNKQKMALLTCKQCLIDGVKEGNLPNTFDDVKAGMMLPGVVKNIQPYGIFVEFANDLYGLVPKQYAADKRVVDLGLLYRQGQSVIAKVVEVNEEKRRFLASLRMQDCYHGDTEIGLTMTLTYLKDRQKLVDIYAKADDMRGVIANMQIGNIHKATVTKTTDIGVICDLDNGVKAIATKDHLGGVTLTEGDTGECVVVYQDFNKQCVEVTFTQDVVKFVGRRNKAKNKNQVTVGQKIKARVVLIKDDFVMVTLRADFKGLLAYLPARRHWNDVFEKYQYTVGQENYVVVKSIEEDIVLVSLKVHEDREITEDSRISHIISHKLSLGDIVMAKVWKIYPDQVYIKIGETHGRLHTVEMVDTVEQPGTSPVTSLKIGSEVKVRVIGFRETRSFKYLPITHPNVSRSMPECSMKPSIMNLDKLPEDFDCSKHNLKVGDKVVAYLIRCQGHSFWAQVTPHVLGKIYLQNMSDNLKKLKSPRENFHFGKGYNATVLAVKSDTEVELTLCEKVPAVAEGQIARGLLTCVKPDTGLVVQLANGIRGNVALTDISDSYTDVPTSAFKVGYVIEGHVQELHLLQKRAVISLRNQSGDNAAVQDRRIGNVGDLSVGNVLRGFVIKISNTGLVVKVGVKLSGTVASDCIVENTPMTKLHQWFRIGSVVTVHVKSLEDTESDSPKIVFSMLEKDTGVPVKLLVKKERKRSISQSSVDSDTTPSPNKKVKKEIKAEIKKERTLSGSSDIDMAPGGASKSKNKGDKSKKGTKGDKSKKRKRTQAEHNAMDSGSEKENGENKVAESSKNNKNVTEVKGKKRKGDNSKDIHKNKKRKGDNSDSGIEEELISGSKVEKKTLEVSEGFSWDTDFKLPALKHEDSSSDEDDDDDKPQRVKKSKEELRRERMEDEKKLYKYEMECLEGDRQPETSDDFDRLVLQSPDSSIIWLRYMAFHLETSEIDRARSVAERALKTIAFREEQEKLNVWVAYLNLENMYGSPESVKKVLSRAVQQNDQVSVYLQMINIYVTSGKPEEGEQLFSTLVKKHSANKDVWLKFGEFFFQQSRHDSARKLMQRSLKSLEMRHHVDIITKFAQMEFKFGEPERGKTMFENILSTYAKRTDLWSVYIDMVTKLGEHDNTRSLYNRVIAQKMSAKKMKFFFKKNLQFEEKHGSEAQIAEVKRKALQYVEGQGFMDD